ncbi:hypothetical protein Vadar_007549 [Vaccinium darrowii]|uniref:Uncharacterized protein n=1 Tax=Vaccinium darrowii TaxID=229202 RepID=A0ACB7Y6Y3_9ERIC|nr:hypothetical protein Vadar_007549 [Vaccinium darrowii]
MKGRAGVLDNEGNGSKGVRHFGWSIKGARSSKELTSATDLSISNSSKPKWARHASKGSSAKMCVLVKTGIGRSSSLFDPRWCDMSGRQIHLTSPELDSGTQFSSFEDLSTSPLMANENADVNQASIEVDAKQAEGTQTQATDNQVEEEQNSFEKKSRKRTSQAWNDFETITLHDGSNKPRCKFCKQTFAIQASGATTTLLRHLGKRVQRRLAVGELDVDAPPRNSIRKYALFNTFMKTATPHWQKISRSTAKNDCVSTYNVQKNKLKTMLKTVNRVSTTIDVWKSPGQKIHYMVVTEVWKIKQTLDKCSEEGEEYLQTMALKMKAKFDKYWGECNLLMALGAALDPRYKMKLVGFCFPEIYNEVDASANISMVRDSLYQLYDVYVAMHSEAFNGESSQQSTTEAGSFNSGPQDQPWLSTFAPQKMASFGRTKEE